MYIAAEAFSRTYTCVQTKTPDSWEHPHQSNADLKWGMTIFIYHFSYQRAKTNPERAELTDAPYMPPKDNRPPSLMGKSGPF